MDYKDFSQLYLQGLVNDIVYDEEVEIFQYDEAQWNNLLNRLSSDLKDNELTEIVKCVNFLIQHKSGNYLENLVHSEIPYILCTNIFNYVKKEMKNADNKKMTTREKHKIANNKFLIYGLFIINESLNIHDFNFNFFTKEIMDAFFVIYEFYGLESSCFAISIITKYAKQSAQNLENLNSLNYMERVMKMCKYPLTNDIRVYSIYALFPFLQVDDKRQSRYIIERLTHIQEQSKSFETLLAISQFFNIYIRYSEECMETAVSNGVIELSMAALTTTNTKDDYDENLTLRNTATDIIILLLNSRFVWYNDMIINNNEIFSKIGCLLSHYEREYDVLAASRLLEFILKESYVSSSEGKVSIFNELVSKLFRSEIINSIIPHICQSLNSYSYSVKTNIIKIISILLRSGNQSLISKFGCSGVFNDIIDSIEDMDDDDKEFTIYSLYDVFQKFEECWNYFDQNEAEFVFSHLNESTQNPSVLNLAFLMSKLLSQC